MILGSLVDAGLPLDRLQTELRRLPVSGWELHARRDQQTRVRRAVRRRVRGRRGPSVPVRLTRRTTTTMRASRTANSRDVLDDPARRAFPATGRAHGRTHLPPPRRRRSGHARHRRSNDVVFHEVGQVDAIVDITGAAIALDLLGVERVHCSALPCGTGRVRSAHGESPSPAPATMELLRGHPTYTIDLDAEFVTPTGAAILTSIASFEPRPPMIDSKHRLRERKFGLPISQRAARPHRRGCRDHGSAKRR